MSSRRRSSIPRRRRWLPIPRPRLEAAIDAAVHGEADLPEWVIAAAIDLLDVVDGDPDLEQCEAGDDGCYYFVAGGRAGWGYDLADYGVTCEYGEDQSAALDRFGKPFAGWDRLPWGA